MGGNKGRGDNKDREEGPRGEEDEKGRWRMRNIRDVGAVIEISVKVEGREGRFKKERERE
jgi:hypothetical protein